ncbi:hypothetical protein [Silvania hatchlandensis]|uniref:Uncharacterized protein n=1 Tax=Silvania hatchlandensis TaxID=2926469 RepID=A0A9J6Q412_9ENTR|nr:hypothetical protein [Silvania hatchlandensis]MCU6664350.1 hypothetical protein [Silvania hatchlandensis]
MKGYEEGWRVIIGLQQLSAGIAGQRQDVENTHKKSTRRCFLLTTQFYP